MTEEEAKKLEKAYAELKEQAAQKDQRIEELEALLMRALLRIEELERRLAKESHNRSKPPSSDGLGRKLRAHRTKSGKPSGGQPGHQGQFLMPVLAPDTVVSHPLRTVPVRLVTGSGEGQRAPSTARFARTPLAGRGTPDRRNLLSGLSASHASKLSDGSGCSSPIRSSGASGGGVLVALSVVATATDL